MRLRDRLGVTERRQHQLVRLLQVVLAAVVAYGAVRLEVSLVVNAGVPLLVTFLPALFERDSSVDLDVGVTLWLATAAMLHAAGALGLYRSVPWFDQLAHTVSAALVAGLGYAVVVALDRHSAAVSFPEPFLAAYLPVFVLAFGVLWELLEFGAEGLAAVLGGEPLLTQYGIDDVVLDLVFDAAGGVVVAVGATGFFEDVAGSVRRLFVRGE